MYAPPTEEKAPPDTARSAVAITQPSIEGEDGTERNEPLPPPPQLEEQSDSDVDLSDLSDAAEAGRDLEGGRAGLGSTVSACGPYAALCHDTDMSAPLDPGGPSPAANTSAAVLYSRWNHWTSS